MNTFELIFLSILGAVAGLGLLKHFLSWLNAEIPPFLRWNRQIETYERSVRALERQPPDGPWRFDLPLDGREIIIPHKLLEGQVYRIELAGSFSWEDDDGYLRTADALYQTDELGNFTVRFDRGSGLQIDRKPRTTWPPHRTVVHEVHRHRYIVEIDGTSDFLSLAYTLGLVALLPKESLKVVIKQAPAAVALERENQRVEEATRRELALARRRASELENKLGTLRLLSEPLQNWSDESFRTAYAAKHTMAVLKDGRSIINKYFDLHRKDPEFIAQVRAEDPETYARLTGKFQCLLLAERLELERAGRKKPTTQQVRERMVRRLKVKGADELALIDTALADYEAKRQRLLESGVDEEIAEDVLGQPSEAVERALERQQKPGNGRETNAAIALG